MDGKSRLRAHVVVAKANGTALVAHLLEGRLWPTLEVMISEIPDSLRSFEL
jgi:predicted DNA-binding protein with PD1-like motif